MCTSCVLAGELVWLVPGKKYRGALSRRLWVLLFIDHCRECMGYGRVPERPYTMCRCDILESIGVTISRRPKHKHSSQENKNGVSRPSSGGRYVGAMHRQAPCACPNGHILPLRYSQKKHVFSHMLTSQALTCFVRRCVYVLHNRHAFPPIEVQQTQCSCCANSSP